MAGDAAVFFERHSSDDLVFELDRIISVTAERMKLVSKGAERLKLFTPEKTMEKTIRVYESLL